MTTTRQTKTPDYARLMTADELFARGSEDGRGELIRGVFYPEMPTGGQHGKIEARVARFVGNLVDPAELGTVMTGDVGIILERDPDTVRAPDVAYYSAERLPLDSDIRRPLEIVPDIVVEVVSPDDRPRAVREKAEMWTAAGVRLVWVVWPDTQSIEIFRPGEATVTVGVDDTLTGQDVLPEFSCPVQDIVA